MDGSTVPADVAVVAIGVYPAVEWLIASGLHLDNGVWSAGNLGALGVPGITAAGDVACWDHPIQPSGADRALGELSPPGGRRSAHPPSKRRSPGLRYADDVLVEPVRRPVQVVGHPGSNDAFEIVEGDLSSVRFVVVYRNGPTLTGALLFNMAATPSALPPSRRPQHDRHHEGVGRRILTPP